jgi:general secretion pathway protein K
MKHLGVVWEWLTRERGAAAVRTARAGLPPRRKRRKQRGVAIITVLIAIAITLVMTNQFSTTTNVDMIAAANYRDQMRAHFLARSAVNLSELVIRLQQRIDNLTGKGGKAGAGGIQITDFADQVLLAFCGNPEEVQAAIGLSSSTTKGLGADVGTCGIIGQITTEDDKLNLNCSNNQQSAAGLKTALEALVFFNGYDPLFEEADAENWRRDRALQVTSILDFVDTDSLRGKERGTTEDYGYESLKDSYKPKNNNLDSVGEIKLARGVDDRFWTLFGHAFTVYGGCKTNLSAVNNVQLIAAILFITAKNPNDPVIQNPQKLFALAGLVAKARQFGMQFTSSQEFIDFVKDPSGAVNMLAGQNTQAGSQANTRKDDVPKDLKLELDKAKLDSITTTGPRRTYRVEAWGEIDRKQKNADGSPVFPPIRRTITGVWDTKITPQNMRKSPAPKGVWAFLKED